MELFVLQQSLDFKYCNAEISKLLTMTFSLASGGLGYGPQEYFKRNSLDKIIVTNEWWVGGQSTLIVHQKHIWR